MRKDLVGNNKIKNFFAKNPHLKYTTPAMLIIFLLSIVPTIFLFIISFTNYQLGWEFSRAKFVGVGNFIRLFSGRDPDFWHSILISILFMLLATSIEMILGYFIASLLNSVEFKLKSLVVAILIIPLAMTPSIAAQMWKLMFNNDYGILNHILTSVFNTSVVWLSKEMAFLSVLIVDIWQFTPFVTLIIYSGLRSLPEDPYEAAIIDGASKIQTLFSITLPLMKPLIFLAILMRAIDSLKLFDTVFVLTQGGPGNATEFLSLHVFRMVNAQNGLLGRGAAMAIVLLVIVNLISRLLIRQQRKEVD